MAVEEALRDYLLANASVSALVGTRFYPDALDQKYHTDQGAAVTYEFISADEQNTLSQGRSGLVHTRVQFVCYAGTRAGAMAAARAIKNSGITSIKGVYSGVDIRGVMIEAGIRTDVESPTDGQAGHRYLAEFDLMVSYLE